jgi:hypothetical protein
MVKTKHPFWGMLTSIAVILLLLEFLPYIMSRAIFGYSFSRRETKKELRTVDGEPCAATPDEEVMNDRQDQYLGDHLLHPYIGFVSVPRDGYNRFGFPGDDPVLRRSEDVINICITGGSVAMQLFRFSKERISDYLATNLSSPGEKVNIVLVALGGFKQPQQLISLNYLMALGAQYDVVINLDGFNEVVLPFSDNLPFGVFPTYPRHWNIYSRKSLDQRVVYHVGKQAGMKQSRENTRKKLAHSFLRHSNFVLFLWKLSDSNKNNQILSSENAIRIAIEESESDYQSTGPAEPFTDTLGFFSAQAAFWADASRQMAALADGLGFRYLHFLQPNQYDAGSKELTGEEMELAYETGHFTYKEAVEIGYPLLREEGAKLIQNGVSFIDLSGVFIHEKRTVYADKCCHFNQLGYDLLADAIALEVLKIMDKP